MPETRKTEEAKKIEGDATTSKTTAAPKDSEDQEAVVAVPLPADGLVPDGYVQTFHPKRGRMMVKSEGAPGDLARQKLREAQEE